MGKLNQKILDAVLKNFTNNDPALIVYPKLGEDFAAIDIDGEEVIVVATDPITLASQDMYHYLLHVNINDIVVSGAKPRWFLANVLCPEGFSECDVVDILKNINDECIKHGVTLCGGHTEITDAVNRTLLIGTLIGTVSKSGLIDKSNIKEGDKILLTKSVGIEGVSIIANESEDKLKKLGVEDSDIKKAKTLIDQISIAKEAFIAKDFDCVHAMHDVTEGGVTAALNELSILCNKKFFINKEQMPILPETKKITDVLNVDPLELIGSGSLIICCREDGSDELMKAIRDAGISISVIGDVRKGIKSQHTTT